MIFFFIKESVPDRDFAVQKYFTMLSCFASVSFLEKPVSFFPASYHLSILMKTVNWNETKENNVLVYIFLFENKTQGAILFPFWNI